MFRYYLSEYSNNVGQQAQLGAWRLDRIELFQIFVRVVDCSSFTKAAAAMGLPRSTVSAAVVELERRVGARLLNRTTRRVSASHDGLAFYDHCQRLIADVEEAESLFRQDGRSLAGRLKVDVPGRIGRLIVAPALPQLLAANPGLRLELGQTDRAVNLLEEGVDCALRVGGRAEAGLVARPLGELPLINVASPAYLASYGTPQSPDDLAEHLTVNYASPSTGRVELWEWEADGELHARPVQGLVTVNNAESYIACCLAGLGMIQVPAYDVRRHITSGELQEVMPKHRARPMGMAIIYPERRHLSKRVQLFADWLEQLLEQHL